MTIEEYRHAVATAEAAYSAATDEYIALSVQAVRLQFQIKEAADRCERLLQAVMDQSPPPALREALGLPSRPGYHTREAREAVARAQDECMAVVRGER